MRPFTFFSPQTIEEARQSFNQFKNAKYLGGGTNLIDLMKEDVERPSQLVDIQSLPYNQILPTASGGLALGALVSNTETANHPNVRKNYPLLSMAMLSAATEQIRNMATNGGNPLQRTRCSYFYETSMPCNKRNPGSGCGALEGIHSSHAIFGWSDQCVAVHPSDMCVALTALNATVVVQKPDGSSRKIPFREFHRLPGDTPEIDNNLQYGELISSIELPNSPYSDHYYYVKVRERSSYAFALVSVAAGLHMEGNTISSACLAMGGVAHKPWKLTEAEAFLKGKTAEKSTFEEAATIAMQEAKPLPQNQYKVELGQKAIVYSLSRARERA